MRELFDMLDSRERWQLVGLTGCMLIMAVLEMTGIASILPFMQVVSRPNLIAENHWLASVYTRLEFSSTESFLLFLGVVLLVLIAINNAFSAFTTWLMYRFAWGQNHRLSLRLLRGYLERPYAYYLDQNTAQLNRNILTEVQSVIQGVILAILRFVARLLVAVLIIGLLAVVDVRIALIVGLVLGSAYGSIYVMLKRRQRQLGRVRLRENGRRFQIAGEALMGIKDVKVLGRERAFLERFREPSWLYCQATASNQIVSVLPRYALETIAFCAILLIVLYSLQASRNLNEVIPVLTLFAFAGYRLIPTLNELFMSAVQVRFHRAALEILHADLLAINEIRSEKRDDPAHNDGAQQAIRLRRELRLKDISFTYPGASIPSVHDLDLTIRARQVVGLVGETGVGKTTLVDLILGLLEPTAGNLEIDGVALGRDRTKAWQRSCGYIAQEIFLSDDSIRANIAFGIPDASIDLTAVENAARMAHIDEFVNTLPEGYDTIVGERGIRLSGGQRQRIGIARALYHDPEVLVMDEATSSLDGVTETAVMETIQRFSKMKTIIVIAHRLTTVRMCDVIHLMKDGRILASGTYEELESENVHFRAMAGLDSVPDHERVGH
jgi:ABC-type multidrug transport system fused ATPase/permease subunit